MGFSQTLVMGGPYRSREQAKDAVVTNSEWVPEGQRLQLCSVSLMGLTLTNALIRLETIHPPY